MKTSRSTKGTRVRDFPGWDRELNITRDSGRARKSQGAGQGLSSGAVGNASKRTKAEC